MRILSRKTLRQFWEIHADAEMYLRVWYDSAAKSSWKSPNDIKNSYANASILKEGRVVFNIKGNDYRLIVKFNYERQWAFIRFVGTHSEYDRIDANVI